MKYEKKYKEALENLKSKMQDFDEITISREDAEEIFPELAESEDERIRRHLIKHFGNKTKKDWNGVPIHSILTWLEKQGGKDKLIQELGEYKVKYTQEVLSQYLEKQCEKMKAKSEVIKDYTGEENVWNNAHDFRPKHLQRCICYDKYMKGVYCYVYDDISKYWCTQTTEEHDPDGDNHICDYADYRVTVWMSLPDTSFYPSKSWLEKQGEKPQGKSAIEIWKDMRFEVGAQASGNRHEPPMSDNDSKLFSLNDIDEIMEKITEKQSGKTYSGKSALEAINEVKVDNSNSVKPADKVEPKFKVGDWISDGNIIIQIEAIKNNCYLYCGDCALYSTKTADKVYHLWTIKDAKDGDVLVTVDDENDERRPFIYKGCLDTNHPDSPVAYCGIDTEGYFCTGNHQFNHWWTDEKVQPAAKEQRDILMKAMADVGYTFDFDKKELKEITSSTYCSENCKGYQETGKCFADGECDSKRKYDNMLDSCEIEHIEDGKLYYCIKDYYAGGNKRASKGDVVQAHRGMSMMALGVKANEYFLPVYKMPNKTWSEEMYERLFKNCHL